MNPKFLFDSLVLRHGLQFVEGRVGINANADLIAVGQARAHHVQVAYFGRYEDRWFPTSIRGDGEFMTFTLIFGEVCSAYGSPFGEKGRAEGSYTGPLKPPYYHPGDWARVSMLSPKGSTLLEERHLSPTEGILGQLVDQGMPKGRTASGDPTRGMWADALPGWPEETAHVWPR